MSAEIRANGPEWLYRYCKQRGLNEQSTYSFLRSFFRFTFKEFKSLERRINLSIKGLQQDSKQDGTLPPCQPD
jgi:hypothetical protein